MGSSAVQNRVCNTDLGACIDWKTGIIITRLEGGRWHRIFSFLEEVVHGVKETQPHPVRIPGAVERDPGLAEAGACARAISWGDIEI